jgi:superfamily II DNA or RNA helicase
MSGKQRRIYEELEEGLVVRIGRAKIKAKLAITLTAKLQQITGGSVRDDDGEDVDVGDAKIRALAIELDKLKGDKPVVIFCKYAREIRLIRRLCYERSTRVGTLTGKIKDTKRHLKRTETISRFQRGEFNYFIVQQQTGGAGLDLYMADDFYVYSHSHSWRQFAQMTARGDHLTRTYPARFMVLFCPDTVDADKKVAIDRKCSVSTVTLNRLRRKMT